MPEFSFPKSKINILLLEKIHPRASELLKHEGFNVSEIPESPDEEQLCELVADIHVLGVRSKTAIPKRVLCKAERLLTIGAFCVGTNNIDLHSATSLGIPVFNAPHANTRSVAELVLGAVIMLSRRAAEKNIQMHSGLWEKNAEGSYEIRGKTIGIVGYGHIGQQVSILAESCGMKVLFYDVIKKLPLGMAQSCADFQELLEKSNFVTLHLPALEHERALITSREITQMRQGSYLINYARGSLVELSDLKIALDSGHIAGAAIDVFPKEPALNSAEFFTELAQFNNVLLSPHIGGSTQEAQLNIGLEVARSFSSFINNGHTAGAVNFPQIEAPLRPDAHRILNIHRNTPGVLSDVNAIISKIGANIEAQYLSTFRDIGYLVMDLDRQVSEAVKKEISALPVSIKTRILY
jgi:D-3-phosphoglycerate dehydrogenase